MDRDQNDTDFLRKLITSVSDENVDLKVKLAGAESEIIRLKLRVEQLTAWLDTADMALAEASEHLAGSVDTHLCAN